METWLPKSAADRLDRRTLERVARRTLRPMRCRFHGGTAWLLKFGWDPSEWEVYATCCPALRYRASTEVYWQLVAILPG